MRGSTVRGTAPVNSFIVLICLPRKMSNSHTGLTKSVFSEVYPMHLQVTIYVYVGENDECPGNAALILCCALFKVTLSLLW